MEGFGKGWKFIISSHDHHNFSGTNRETPTHVSLNSDFTWPTASCPFTLRKFTLLRCSNPILKMGAIDSERDIRLGEGYGESERADAKNTLSGATSPSILGINSRNDGHMIL